MEYNTAVLRLGTALAMVLLATVYSCNFAQSINKDLKTGLVTRGNGLACDQVYLSSDEEVIQRNEFIYGETYNVTFNNIDGFNRLDNRAFPGMQLVVVNHQGDTMMKHSDLYASFEDGIEHDPLQLYSEVTVANPIHSNGAYTLFVSIWDKKGKGRFSAKLDFSVVPNDKIVITSNQISCDEIYLFSQQRGLTVTDNKVGFEETIFMLFEGLEGLAVEGENVYLGLGIIIKDADGNLILNEQDLIGDSGMSYQDIHSQLAPNFVLTGDQISNPVTCEITIWDKKSPASMKASTQIQVE